MLCVVKRLACGDVVGCGRRRRSPIGSASSSALRYAFVAGSFVWPKFRSCRNVVVSSGSPSASWTPRVTTSRYVESWASCSSLSTCSVFVDGSQTAWLMPTTWPPGPIEEDVRARDGREVDRPRERDRDPRLDVEAVERVEDGDVGAVARLAAQFGCGRSTRSPCICVASATVSRLVGVGWPADVAAKAVAGNASTRATTRIARPTVLTRSPPF